MAMTDYNENLVLIPHTDNCWIDPRTIAGIWKQSADAAGRVFVVFYMSPRQPGAEDRRSYISSWFGTSALADEAIAAVTSSTD